MRARYVVDGTRLRLPTADVADGRSGKGTSTIHTYAPVTDDSGAAATTTRIFDVP